MAFQDDTAYRRRLTSNLFNGFNVKTINSFGHSHVLLTSLIFLFELDVEQTVM